MNTANFQKIPDAARSTGLSQSFLRRGCKAGTVPHVMSGNVYYVDVGLLVEQLRARMSGGDGDAKKG